MAHYGRGVEDALHCLTVLAHLPHDAGASARDLAEYQGISASMLAKYLPKLEKAGIIVSVEGARGGYRLAREATEISLLEVAEAVEGRNSLFECRNIRANCAVFEGEAPKWALAGVCSIHAAMLRAEQIMRESLAGVSLSDVMTQFSAVAPIEFFEDSGEWFAKRAKEREAGRGWKNKD